MLHYDRPCGWSGAVHLVLEKGDFPGPHPSSSAGLWWWRWRWWKSVLSVPRLRFNFTSAVRSNDGNIFTSRSNIAWTVLLLFYCIDFKINLPVIPLLFVFFFIITNSVIFSLNLKLLAVGTLNLSCKVRINYSMWPSFSKATKNQSTYPPCSSMTSRKLVGHGFDKNGTESRRAPHRR